MRILICASDTPLPPMNTGYRRQVKGLIRELGREHQVRFIGYRMPDQDAGAPVDERVRIVPYQRPGAIDNAGDLLGSIVGQRPLRVARFARGLRGPLIEELERFKPDIVHVGPGKLAGLWPYLAGYPAVLGVMDTWHVNVVARAEASSGIRRALFLRDLELVKRFEASEYRRFDRVVACSQDDLEELRAVDPAMPLTVIPNGFDAHEFAPDPTATRDPNRIIFHGAMNYPPNVICAEHLVGAVMPRVWAQHDSAHLAIVGRDPAPRVRALHAPPRVIVTGEVEDMRGWLTSSRVFAAPHTHGTGMKTKLLEAMATELPSVVTPTGGRGMDLDAGALLVGETAEDVAGHIVSVLRDDALAARVGRAAGEYVRRHYDWPVVSTRFAQLYGEVVSEYASRPREISKAA